MNEKNKSSIDRLFRADPAWQPDVNRGLVRLRERKRARNAQKRGGMLVTACATAVVCVPLIAFPATRALAARCVSACVAETSAVRSLFLGGESFVPPSRTYIAPDQRKIAPDFTLDDASGQSIALSGLRGKVVLLNFWATWCPPCAQEIPWFMEFQRANADRGLAVLGVSMDRDGWKSVKPFIDARQVNYSVVIGDEKVASLFGGVNSLPLSLIIDRSGRVAAVHAGLCTRDEYQTDIEAVLNER